MLCLKPERHHSNSRRHEANHSFPRLDYCFPALELSRIVAAGRLLHGDGVRSISRINDSFPKMQWYWAVVHAGFEPTVATAFWCPCRKILPDSDTFQPISVVRPTDALPLPSESQPIAQRDRFPERQLNNPACGGARLSGNRTGSADRASPNR